MCMYETTCDDMYDRNSCSLLEVTLDPCESETCLCFQKGPPPLLLSVAGWREGGLQETAKGMESSQGVKPHLSPPPASI